MENICNIKITKVAIKANIKAVYKCKTIPSNSKVDICFYTIKYLQNRYQSISSLVISSDFYKNWEDSSDNYLLTNCFVLILTVSNSIK